MKLTIIILLLLINYTFGNKTIKLSVEYPKSNHHCLNERDTIAQINYLNENFKKEKYYYTSHEITGITNTVKIVSTKYNTKYNKNVVYYNYIIITIDIIFSNAQKTITQEIKMSDECINYFSKQKPKNKEYTYSLIDIIIYIIILSYIIIS